MPKKRANIEIENQTWKDMRKLAIQLGLEVNGLVEEAFQDYVKKKIKEGVRIG